MRTPIQPRARALVAGVLAGVVLAAATAAPAQAADFSLTLDTGHIDAFTLTYEQDELVLHLQEDVTGNHVLHPPQDVLLLVKPDAELTLPDPVPSSLAFLGAHAGKPVYLLPQSQNPNLVWPGWSTERLPSGVFQGPLQIAVSEVTGPGDVFLWQTGSFGASISVLGGGYQLPGTITPNVNVHAHANWAFTEPGRYTLQVRASGTLATGGTVSSQTTTYTFDVGGVEPPVSPTLAISGLSSSYAPGDVVTLTATQDPQTALDHYHWFTRTSDADEWSVVGGASAAEYSFVAAAGDDGRQVIVRLYGENESQVAESAPVTLAVTTPGGEEPPEPGDAAEFIVATRTADSGSLVMSVDPADNTVSMSDFELNATADRWTSSGQLRPVTVADTRAGAPGWSVSGQVSDFIAGAGVLSGAGLGWTPTVAEQPAGGGVSAGSAVAPGQQPGEGLAASRTLASAALGSGAGTSRLGAGLTLEAPSTLAPGTYQATITFTVI